MKRSKTARGFTTINFKDIYGENCSIQKSSLAEKDAIWLGQDEVKFHNGQALSPRMHIDKPLVRKLIKKLQHFVDTGEI